MEYPEVSCPQRKWILFNGRRIQRMQLKREICRQLTQGLSGVVREILQVNKSKISWADCVISTISSKQKTTQILVSKETKICVVLLMITVITSQLGRQSMGLRTKVVSPNCIANATETSKNVSRSVKARLRTTSDTSTFYLKTPVIWRIIITRSAKNLKKGEISNFMYNLS